MPELAEPFVPFIDDRSALRRAGDAPLPIPEPRPDGYVSYAPTRTSVPDRYFFALSVVHAMRCATAAATLITASRSGNVLSLAVLPLVLTASHAALVVGCHRQRAWAKLGSIIIDIQASFITIVALIAVSEFELSWNAMVRQVVLPAITIWLALKARVDRRRR
jgi:hypothetical protein